MNILITVTRQLDQESLNKCRLSNCFTVLLWLNELMWEVLSFTVFYRRRNMLQAVFYSLKFQISFRKYGLFFCSVFDSQHMVVSSRYLVVFCFTSLYSISASDIVF